MKTVKVKIALAVDHEGNWCASGSSKQKPGSPFECIVDDLQHGEAHYFVNVEVAIAVPKVAEVDGTVEPIAPGEHEPIPSTVK